MLVFDVRACVGVFALHVYVPVTVCVTVYVPVCVCVHAPVPYSLKSCFPPVLIFAVNCY